LCSSRRLRPQQHQFEIPAASFTLRSAKHVASGRPRHVRSYPRTDTVVMLGKVSSAYTCWDEHVRRRAWGCLLRVTQGTAVLCFMVCTQQVCELRDLQWWENDMASRKDVLMAVFTSCDKCVLWGFGGTDCRSFQGDSQGHVEAGVIEGMCGLCRNVWGYFGQSQLGNWGGGRYGLYRCRGIWEIYRNT
jgi:hypothetical protein